MGRPAWESAGGIDGWTEHDLGKIHWLFWKGQQDQDWGRRGKPPVWHPGLYIELNLLCQQEIIIQSSAFPTHGKSQSHYTVQIPPPRELKCQHHLHQNQQLRWAIRHSLFPQQHALATAQVSLIQRKERVRSDWGQHPWSSWSHSTKKREAQTGLFGKEKDHRWCNEPKEIVVW